MSKMRLLITGSDGFTGRHLSLIAKARGYEVYPNLSDITEAQALGDEVRRIAPTHVIHLAAISAVTHAHELDFYRVNVIGTDNLLKALATLPKSPEKVVHASSANVYGNTTHSPIAEEHMPAPVNHYAISKLAMEKLLHIHAERLPLVLVRPFNYTGVGHDSRFVIPKLIEHFSRHAPEIELGNLFVEREFNDVRMVTDAYLRLLDAGRTGEIYNICTGKTYSPNQILQILTGLTGQTPLIRVNPDYVRKNEILRLCGLPTKLISAIGGLKEFALSDTLRWMLSEAGSGVPAAMAAGGPTR